MKAFVIAVALLILTCTIAFGQGTWQLIGSAPALQRIDDICFVNDSTGFFGSNSPLSKGIFKSTDRGDNWNLISADSSGYIRSIEFINDTLGFYGTIDGAQAMPGSLYKTVDGGYTWNRLTNMQMQLTDGICGIAHFQNSVVAVGTYSGPAWFYRSDDFGISWTRQDLSAFASGLVDCYLFNHDTILISGIADSASQYKATILKSVDGGATWQRVFLAATPTSYCWKMFFKAGGSGLSSIEGSSAIARTNDQGTTWTEQLISNPASNDFGAIGLLNDTLGWVTSQNNSGYPATWQTQDGGITWDSVNTVIESGDRMVVLDSVTALISGKGIYKYTYGVTGLHPIASPVVPVHSLLLYPNPAINSISIDACAGTNTFGLLDVLDEQGLPVMHIARQRFTKGKYTFNISVEHLPAASYKLLWRTNELFLAKGFIVKK